VKPAAQALRSTPTCPQGRSQEGLTAVGDANVTPVHRIVIEPTGIRGERGQRYRVRFGGEVLIADTWNPEFEACRALAARGFTGPFEVWRVGKAHPDMLIPDIEEGARWTVLENVNVGLVIVRWRPWSDDIQPDAFSRHAVLAPEAAQALGGETCPR
jgi:hypothetical protein